MTCYEFMVLADPEQNLAIKHGSTPVMDEKKRAQDLQIMKHRLEHKPQQEDQEATELDMCVGFCTCQDPAKIPVEYNKADPPTPIDAPSVAATRFSLAMLRRDATAGFEAWRDYFWLTDTDAPQALGQYTGRVQATFNAGLAAHPENPNAIAFTSLHERKTTYQKTIYRFYLITTTCKLTWPSREVPTRFWRALEHSRRAMRNDKRCLQILNV